ncbi:MAG: DUF2330 domain-containing protein [Candidatus Omnitrophota bacterium]|nr:DUF2330 domain-containing protein [Candidatus Omnitrophota bacterium]
MKRFFLFILFLIYLCNFTYADRGSIPFKPHIRVFEPTQRAMIAWNGKEEILLLSTDMSASGETQVLEVLPLPSEPVVKKGDVEVFRKATVLINEKLKEQAAKNLGANNVRTQSKGRPAGEVTFHEKIGAHDILVTHVINSSGFIEWVERYLRKAEVENPIIPQIMKDSISEYLKEGFSWFVFDVILLNEVPKTNEAIQYRFATDVLFYPLKISRTNEGETSVELLILTRRLLGNFSGLPVKRVNLPHEPVDITSVELCNLNEEMDDLLGHQETMKLRIWEIRGQLSLFDKDLIAQ